VPVDVRVLDRSGKAVTDLAPSDFTVLENGARQPVRHFAAIGLSAEPAGSNEGLALREADSDPLAPRNRRVFLIVLGNGRLQTATKGIDAALTFVRQRLLPQDRVAVLAFNRATDFTTDHERIAQVLERFRKTNDRIDAEMSLFFSGLRAVYGGTEIPDSIQKDVDHVFDTAGTTGVRTVTTARVANGDRIGNDQRQAIGDLQASEIATTDPATSADASASLDAYAGAMVSANQDLQRLYAGIGYLRAIDGEKHLVYFTENGISLPRGDDDEGLAAIASDARVVLDPVKTGGVEARVDLGLSAPAGRGNAPMGARIGAPSANDWHTQTLRNYAGLTGGQAGLGISADRAMANLDASTRFGYLLGYYPSNPALDGKYRHIAVTVNRPGLTVLYRHGYFANVQAAPIDRRQMLTEMRVGAAGGYRPEIKDIPLALTVAVAAKGTANAVDAELRIDASRLTFTMADGRHVARIYVVLSCGDRREATVGEMRRAVDFTLTEETYRQFLKAGVPVSAHIPTTAPAAFVKAIVYDYGADLVGSTSVKVK
jgi:VWFA-related protein